MDAFLVGSSKAVAPFASAVCNVVRLPLTIRISTVDEAVTVIVDTIAADLGHNLAGRVVGAGGVAAVDEAVTVIVETIAAELGSGCRTWALGADPRAAILAR